MPFKQGEGGRQPGATNLLTRTVKETVLAAFNSLQKDKKNNILAFAKKHPRDFYNIAAKLIPTDIKADVRITKTTLEIVRTIHENLLTDTPSITANGNGNGKAV